MRGERSGGVEEGEGRGRDEPEEGIGLVGPVEPTGSTRVTGGKRMLGPVVVGNGLVYVLGLVLRGMVGEAGCGGVNHCRGEERPERGRAKAEERGRTHLRRSGDLTASVCLFEAVGRSVFLYGRGLGGPGLGKLE